MAEASAGHHIEPSELVDAIVEKLVAKSGGGGGEPPSTFWGIDSGGWTKMLLTGLFSAVLFGVGWYITVNAALDKRPTIQQLDRRIDKHSARPHPNGAAAADVKEIKGQVRTIELEQREQSTKLESIEKGIDDLKKSMQRRRR